MTTSTLQVYKGEASENITILTKDVLGQDVDLSFAATSVTTIEVKDKPGGTIKTTLTGADIVSLGTTQTIVAGTKFYALDNGDYFVKFSAKDVPGRIKILEFHLVVRDV